MVHLTKGAPWDDAGSASTGARPVPLDLVRPAAQGPRWDALGIGYYRSLQVPWPTR
ncbi:hypothetical protein [Streptomyces sp. ME19-01-6]|uniref:hypothetical protein n=1 Tax=Streptomyces sp. ME19-01-6 TaxID=3028686 RepID=UPI0029B9A473|nr:hypothetical protein [Streptomyces sp. ME19-01-6]MDX3229825.1 hypothetical protein [Streptomyces sp. ME19-01-6]